MFTRPRIREHRVTRTGMRRSRRAYGPRHRPSLNDTGWVPLCVYCSTAAHALQAMPSLSRSSSRCGSGSRWPRQWTRRIRFKWSSPNLVVAGYCPPSARRSAPTASEARAVELPQRRVRSVTSMASSTCWRAAEAAASGSCVESASSIWPCPWIAAVASSSL